MPDRIDSTCCTTRPMTAMDASTAASPFRPISLARCAPSATLRARCAACSVVCATWSTVAAVCATAAMDSLAPLACSDVAARISAALVARTPVVSRNGRVMDRITSKEKKMPATRVRRPAVQSNCTAL